MLPGQRGRCQLQELVDAQEDVFHHSGAQLVRILHHFHDPAQQRRTGKRPVESVLMLIPPGLLLLPNNGSHHVGCES